MKRTWIGFALLALAVPGCGDDSRVSRVAAQLTQYQTCSDLEGDLKDALIAEINAEYQQIKDGNSFGPGGIGDGVEAPGAEGAAGDSRQEGVDYSGTNNQEEGVDEGDFVKTDGYNVYVLNGNRLHIFGVPEFGELDPLSEIELEGIPREMLVSREANRAVVFSQIYPWTLPEGHPVHDLMGEQIDDQIGWMWRTNGLSKLTVLDISDRSNPTLVRELFVEGDYQTARLIDGSVRVGSFAHIAVPGSYGWSWYYDYDAPFGLEVARNQAIAAIQAAELGDMVPRIHERLPSGQLVTHALTGNACRGFYRPGKSSGRGFTSLLSLDLFGSSMKYDADHVVSNYSQLYASKDSIYIAEQARDWWWFWWNRSAEDETNIHKFDISTPGRAYYRGSGRIPGVINNQFSMSEDGGLFRVASTTNPWARWWDQESPPAQNHVFVLEPAGDRLEILGHVGGIAEGERIFAARFLGDKGYLVTFQQTDPLFTIDLSDPTAPKVVGELEIPGFSNYLHPLGDTHLLGIGVGGDASGANWRTQVSLFDVSDFANPTRADALELALPGGWSWSEARWDHKAFQYWGPEKLLAVPVSTYAYNDIDGYQYLSTLELVSVDEEAGLASYGSIDHSSFYNSDSDYYWAYTDIRRSIFMGDFVYAISDRGISVHALAGLPLVTSQPLPGYTGDWYWWW